MIINGTENDNVIHYGYAGNVEVTKVAKASYDEYGVVGRLEVEYGHVDIKAEATVYQCQASIGTDSLVSVDANATVYDINSTKVEGSLTKDTVRFTASTENEHTDETITASACTHPLTEDVIDGQHVYEVCKKCGYTVIKVDGVKKSVSDSEDSNVIIPKAQYDGTQVSAGGNNGNVQINKNADGDYVTPSIEETPVIDNDNGNQNCDHTLIHEHNGEQCITRCTKCGLSYAAEHDYFNESTKKFYSNCPVCEATLGTEEIPYHVTNAVEFRATSNMSKKYLKQTKDFDINTNQYAYYLKGCEYDGNGHSIKLAENYTSDSHWECAFYTPLDSFVVKNLDFYSNDDSLLALIFSDYNYGKYTIKLNVLNCNARSRNGKTIELGSTNATVFLWSNGQMNYNRSTNKYCAGETELHFSNCNNYVSIKNNSASISMMLSWGLYWDDYKKITFDNCNNYGTLESNSAAGLITSHLYGNYYKNDLKWTAAQLIDSVDVNDCHNYGVIKAPDYVGMFCDANGTYCDANGNEYCQKLNDAYYGLSGNYIKISEFTENYSLGFNNGQFEINTNSTKNYTYKLGININSITYNDTGYICNTTVLTLDINNLDSTSNAITSSNIHVYDYLTAINDGIIKANTKLSYSNEYGIYNAALYEKNGNIYIIIDEDEDVTSNSSVSLTLFGYYNGQSVGFKDLD